MSYSDYEQPELDQYEYQETDSVYDVVLCELLSNVIKMAMQPDFYEDGRTRSVKMGVASRAAEEAAKAFKNGLRAFEES